MNLCTCPNGYYDNLDVSSAGSQAINLNEEGVITTGAHDLVITIDGGTIPDAADIWVHIMYVEG